MIHFHKAASGIVASVISDVLIYLSARLAEYAQLFLTNIKKAFAKMAVWRISISVYDLSQVELIL